MTTYQKIIKYAAMVFAIFLIVSVVGGMLSLLGLFGGFFVGDGVTDGVKIYPVSSNIRSLEVDINSADFTIKQGESFSVESNLKYLTVREKTGVLTIRENKRVGISYTGAILTLYIPANTGFEKADINTGAGRLTADYLSADKLNFELGVGEVRIDKLIASAGIRINGGAGSVTISDGSLHNLDLDMGVGQLNLTSVLIGDSEFDLGVGESNITLIGNKDDYKLDIEKGLGNITIDGTNISSIEGYGDGKNCVDIEGGVGTINVKFKEMAVE